MPFCRSVKAQIELNPMSNPEFPQFARLFFPKRRQLVIIFRHVRRLTVTHQCQNTHFLPG